MVSERRFQCVAIRSPRGATVTEIDWADGHKSVYPHVILRGYCPCAGCQGHSGTIRYIDPGPRQIELEDLEVVGNYALRLEWFDGHGTGLYSYKYLRALCRCDECEKERGDSAAERPDLPRV